MLWIFKFGWCNYLVIAGDLHLPHPEALLSGFR